MELVKKALPALLKEYQFWNSGTLASFFSFSFLEWNQSTFGEFHIFIFVCLKFKAYIIYICLIVVSGIHKVTIEDGEANKHILSRYYAKWNKPRPEASVKVCFLTTHFP